MNLYINRNVNWKRLQYSSGDCKLCRYYIPQSGICKYKHSGNLGQWITINLEFNVTSERKHNNLTKKTVVQCIYWRLV